METNCTQKGRTQFKSPVIAQFAAMIFGLIFAFSEKYSGWEMVCALLGAPIVFAGMVRVIIGMNRVAATLTAKRIYDGAGNCIGLVPARGISIVVALIGFAAIITGFIKIAQSTEILKIVIIVVVLALEVFVFCKDVKRFAQPLKSEKER